MSPVCMFPGRGRTEAKRQNCLEKSQKVRWGVWPRSARAPGPAPPCRGPEKSKTAFCCFSQWQLVVRHVRRPLAAPDGLTCLLIFYH
jgi:hypothetical protein